MTKAIKILIADDHHLVRQGLKLILNNHQTQSNFDITEVDSGEKAVSIYQKEHFDLVLMDISMGGMSGINATQEIVSFHKSAKIIALSMHNETYIIKKMLIAGASGYLLKDTESYELTKAIETVLDGQKYFTNEVSLKLMDQFKEKKRDKFNTKLPTSLKISDRELEILNMIAKQMTNIEIANKLELRKRTVDTYRQRLMEKFEVKNTVGLLMFAIKHHLIID